MAEDISWLCPDCGARLCICSHLSNKLFGDFCCPNCADNKSLTGWRYFCEKDLVPAADEVKLLVIIDAPGDHDLRFTLMSATANAVLIVMDKSRRTVVFRRCTGVASQQDFMEVLYDEAAELIQNDASIVERINQQIRTE